jgi:hypothetical protein
MIAKSQIGGAQSQMSLFRRWMNFNSDFEPMLGIVIHTSFQKDYPSIEAAAKVSVFNLKSLVIIIKCLITLIFNLNSFLGSKFIFLFQMFVQVLTGWLTRLHFITFTTPIFSWFENVISSLCNTLPVWLYRLKDDILAHQVPFQGPRW